MAQTQDLAFCIAQLPLNDKAVKKLDALAKTYRNALFDDDVFKSFQLLVAKARKFAKPELRDALNDFAAKITAFHDGTAGSVDGALAAGAEGGDAPLAEAPLVEADANASEAAQQDPAAEGKVEGPAKCSRAKAGKENTVSTKPTRSRASAR
jgi:condensin complex subunit 1